MKRLRINITQKFVIYLMVISIIPLLAVGIRSYTVSDAILQEEAIRFSTSIVTHHRDYLDLELEQIGSLIANISGVEEITNTLGDEEVAEDTFTNLVTQARIGYILNGYSNFHGSVSTHIFTVNGAHYHAGDTLDVSNIRTDVRDDIFAKAIASDQIILWSGVEDNVNGNSVYEKVLTVAKAVTRVNPDTLQSEPVALFLVNVRLDEIYTHFSHADLGEGAYMMAIDAENRIIYHPDLAYIGDSLDEINADLADLLTEDTGQITTVINGEEMFVSYTRSSLSGWVTLSFIPLDTLAAKTAVIRNNMLVILLISFLVVGAFAWRYNRDVVLPIREITRHFQQLQAGSLDENTRMAPYGNDEIGELVQWFNAFMDTFAAQHEAEAQIEASLREKEALLQEVHHRVKNNLQIISSLLHLQSSRIDDSKITAVFQDSQNRIRSMSLIHEKLYRSQDFTRIDLGEYVQMLTAYLVRSYQINVGLIALEVETDEVYLSIDTAVPCGLLLNELISNALKHAFPSGRQGKIFILLHAEDRKVTLIVGDNGVGIPDIQMVDNEDTLGFQLIETLAQQIGANIQMEVDHGTKFIITFDIPAENDN